MEARGTVPFHIALLSSYRSHLVFNFTWRANRFHLRHHTIVLLVGFDTFAVDHAKFKGLFVSTLAFSFPLRGLFKHSGTSPHALWALGEGIFPFKCVAIHNGSIEFHYLVYFVTLDSYLMRFLMRCAIVIQTPLFVLEIHGLIGAATSSQLPYRIPQRTPQAWLMMALQPLEGGCTKARPAEIISKSLMTTQCRANKIPEAQIKFAGQSQRNCLDFRSTKFEASHWLHGGPGLPPSNRQDS